MPTDLGEQTKKSPASKITTRSSSRSRERTLNASTSGDTSVAASSNWFRNFTCFSNESEGEQGALDLSGVFTLLCSNYSWWLHVITTFEPVIRSRETVRTSQFWIGIFACR